LGCPDDDRCDGGRLTPERLTAWQRFAAESSSIAADLAAWNRHQRQCGTCLGALKSTQLCLAGATLWERAGLEVIPVPERTAPVPPPIPGTGLSVRGHMARPLPAWRTSELLRVVAAACVNGDPLAPELRARAAYLETLGDHDHGRVPA
jgi:hypothetical protein